MYRKTYIEINTENLKYNVHSLIKNYPDYKYYFGVVKGNAYGHGMEVVKKFIDAGINYLAVSTLEEAINIRNFGIVVPILCLQPIHIEDISDAIKNDITITLSNYEYFKELIKLQLNKELKIHLKINTGFNRLGISKKDEVSDIFKTLNSSTNFKLEGIYSHFATTGVNDKHWDNQLQAFREITSAIDLKQILIVHFGRSLTLLNHKKIDFCNSVRIGVAMYGYSRPIKKSFGIKPLLKLIKNLINKRRLKISDTVTDFSIDFKNGFKLFSEIIEIQKVKTNDFVGYGATFKATSDCYIGFLPIGYADGFLKKNINGFVFINNKRYKILAVDMGMTTILIDEYIRLYDKVEIIGDNISLYEVAKRKEMTIYETMCSFKESIPRKLI